MSSSTFAGGGGGAKMGMSAYWGSPDRWAGIGGGGGGSGRSSILSPSISSGSWSKEEDNERECEQTNPWTLKKKPGWSHINTHIAIWTDTTFYMKAEDNSRWSECVLRSTHISYEGLAIWLFKLPGVKTRKKSWRRHQSAFLITCSLKTNTSVQ